MIYKKVKAAGKQISYSYLSLIILYNGAKKKTKEN